MRMPRFLQKLTATSVERTREEEQMSPAERAFDREGVEGLQADEFVEEHLGGSDPRRLLDFDEPPRL